MAGGSLPLERKYPDRLGRRDQVKHSGSIRTEKVEIPDDAGRLEEVGGILADIGVVGGER